jgi:hypothetical protein
MSLPVTLGFVGVSGIISIGPITVTTTKFTVFDSDRSGFRIVTGKFPAVARSVEVRAVVQVPFETQEVARVVPLTRIVEPGPGLVGTKLPPKTCNVKLPAPPAVALAGNRLTIVIALVIVTLELPVRDESSELVATMLTAFGEGVEIGAV